jgi:4-oxalocrotonate tautomerase
MPFANFKFPEGVIDAARKEEIIHRTTAMNLLDEQLSAD